MSHHGPDLSSLTAEKLALPAGHGWNKIPAIGAVLGLLGLGAAFGLGMSHRHDLFPSYLVAFLFWLSLGLGGLFFVLVQYAARAGWSVVVRRIAELLMSTLPLFIVLFIPIAIGLHDLYHWSHPEAVAHDELLKHKAPYLNPTFFFIRAGVFLGSWALLARYYWKRSTTQDKTGDKELTRRMQVMSGPAIAIFGVTVTYAAIDWLMTLDPHWFSTMFGVYYFAGSIVSTYSTMALFALAMRKAKVPGADLITTEHFHDLGKLMFAFTVFWAYIAFSQYMLIWYANLPEETVWFAYRWDGTWKYLSILLGVGHFVVPFFFLLPRTIKRTRGALFLAAIWIICMQAADLYWLVMPVFHKAGPHVTLIDVAAFVGVGGLFVGLIGWRMKKVPLVPVKDPRLAESVSFENF